MSRTWGRARTFFGFPPEKLQFCASRARTRKPIFAADVLENILAVVFVRELFSDESNEIAEVAGEEIPSNITAITADITARHAFPTYTELVTSFGRLAIPDKGYPSLTLKGGDEYLTG